MTPTKQVASALDQLAELDAGVSSAEAQVNDSTVAEAAQNAAAKAARLQQDRADARLDAQRKRSAWMAENRNALMVALREEAEQVAATLVAKVEELEQARRAWHATATRVIQVAGPFNVNHPARLPNFDQVDQAVRGVQRVTADLPLPLPREPEEPTQ